MFTLPFTEAEADQLRAARDIIFDDATIERIALALRESMKGRGRSRNCKHCARPFTPTNSAQRYCCPDHQNAAAQATYRRKK